MVEFRRRSETVVKEYLEKEVDGGFYDADI